LAGLNANVYADAIAAGSSVYVDPANGLGVSEAFYSANPDLWFLFPNALSMSMIGMALVTTFGTWGSPQMSTRFFATKNRRSIRYGMIISCMWVAVVSFCAWFAGYVGRGQIIGGGATESLKDFAMNMNGLVDPADIPGNWYEYTMPWLIDRFVTQGVIPIWMAAIFLASVTAASLTTGEKLVLVASGSIGRDVYQKGIFKNKNISDEKALKVTRISIVVIVAVAIVLALIQPAAILDLCMFSWASLTAFTLIPFVAGLYWKGGTKKAALISGITAMTIAVIWFVFFDKDWRLAGLPLFPRDNPQGLWDFSEGLGNAMLFEIPSIGLKAYPRDIHEFLVSQGVAIPIFFIVSWLDKKGKPEKKFLDEIFNDMILNINQ
jgi:Na+/proline symporter